MSFLVSPWSLKLRYSISLSLCLIFLGCVLAAYHTPLIGWVGTLFCLAHLAKRGRSAIPLSLAWIQVVIWVAAFRYAQPFGFVWRDGRYWAGSLIFLWLAALIITFTVAKAPEIFQMTSAKRRGFWLLSCGSMGISLGMGSVVYSVLI